jgi:hypothetical protein
MLAMPMFGSRPTVRLVSTADSYARYEICF